jgi:flagellar protein FlaG
VQSKEELEDLVEDIQEATRVMQRNLNFSVDDSTGVTVIKVTDAQSGDVIRQMPTEEALRLAERLDEMRSLLFETRA